MKVADKLSTSILDKFPEKEVELLELYQNNEDFRSLCEDYDLCVKMQLHYQKNNSANKKLIRHYIKLLRNLGKELEYFLKK